MYKLSEHGGSHAYTQKRFYRDAAAKKYPAEFRAGLPRDRREMRAIQRALTHIPAGSTVLDLPCGTGRGTRLLLDRGFTVIAADGSQPMLEQARDNLRIYREQAADALPEVSFAEIDVLRTGCPDDYVDAVFCNRLFHHFSESETRLQGLSELRRISAGPVIISFFNAFAFDAAYRKVRNRVLGRKPVDRIPIRMSSFEAEIRAAGFRVRETIAVRWGISPHWYVVAD